MKKLKNLVLAVLVLFASVFTVNVLANEATGKITISNAKAGKKYEIYKIFDLTYSETNKENVAYTVDSDWVGFFFGTGASGAEYIVNENNATNTLNSITYDGVKYFINITDSNKIAFANDALVYLKDLEADDSKTPTADGTVEFTGLAHGYYLIYPVGATEKNDANGTIVSIDSTVQDIEVTLKAGYPELKKEVNNFTFDVGQYAEFTITGKVPDTTGFKSYTYTINDNWTKGLALDTMTSTNTFVVTIGGKSVNLAPKYTYDDNGVANGFTLDIPVVDYQTQIGAEIKVTYKLLVTKDAIMSKNTYNEAYLDYSTDPKTEETSKTTPDREYVYSSKVVVTKYDGNDEDVKLAGAKFILKKGNLFYAVNKTTGKVTWEENQSSATELTTDENGVVEFTGLADGTYTLVETAAPEGYNLLTETVSVTIESGKDDVDQSHEIPVAAQSAVANYSGAQLPSTGGFGTKLFVLIGSLIAMISGVVLVTNKRMAKEEI